LEYICNETLSNLGKFDISDAQCEIQTQSEHFVVEIKRIK